ncbi:unnamed protein product [Gordionus sp. m RMFG-2023]
MQNTKCNDSALCHFFKSNLTFVKNSIVKAAERNNSLKEETYINIAFVSGGFGAIIFLLIFIYICCNLIISPIQCKYGSFWYRLVNISYRKKQTFSQSQSRRPDLIMKPILKPLYRKSTSNGEDANKASKILIPDERFNYQVYFARDPYVKRRSYPIIKIQGNYSINSAVTPRDLLSYDNKIKCFSMIFNEKYRNHITLTTTNRGIINDDKNYIFLFSPIDKIISFLQLGKKKISRAITHKSSKYPAISGIFNIKMDGKFLSKLPAIMKDIEHDYCMSELITESTDNMYGININGSSPDLISSIAELQNHVKFFNDNTRRLSRSEPLLF